MMQMRQRHVAASVAAAAQSSDASDAAAAASSSSRRSFGMGGARTLPAAHLLAPLLLFFLVALFAFVLHRHTSLPQPLSADAPSSHFSEERARVHLHALCGAGRERTTGSYANEVVAPRYILSQLSALRGSLANSSDWRLDVSLHRPSGTFDLDFLAGFTSAYLNVTNIAARLVPLVQRHAGRRSDESSLLISGHFDSALDTQAATDNAANVANMLEAMRAIANGPPLASAVIFLFNGAEETILQAAHGFITQHKWAPTISAFLNFEGAGGSGRELVFQTGPKNDWLARAYSAAAPYPFASIMAQNIFQSGVRIITHSRCRMQH